MCGFLRPKAPPMPQPPAAPPPVPDMADTEERQNEFKRRRGLSRKGRKSTVLGGTGMLGTGKENTLL
tara:strand:- start:1160 stop:1360 length:201 start_codon:yes stop_codon:yes gene_type:complete